jgi:hypothetical protein
MGDMAGYSGVQRNTSGYSGILRDTAGYSGIQQDMGDTAGYSGIRRDTAGYDKKILQCSGPMRCCFTGGMPDDATDARRCAWCEVLTSSRSVGTHQRCTTNFIFFSTFSNSMRTLPGS